MIGRFRAARRGFSARTLSFSNFEVLGHDGGQVGAPELSETAREQCGGGKAA